jgi:triphosphatase
LSDAPADDPPTLELSIDPAQLERLLRGKALAALRQGVSRGSRVALVWHDTADGRLAARGQALTVQAARRGAVQRLHQVLPEPEQVWLPGMPAETLAHATLPGRAPDPAALGLQTTSPLVGLVAAEGQERRQPLMLDGAALTLSVQRLRLRSVAAEQELALLRLVAAAGAAPDLPYRAALMLAAETPLTPAWPLAEAARAMARGEPPRPPRRGAPELAQGLSVEQGFARAASHLASVLAWLAPAAALGERDAVHQMRVAIRRLRSGFALWRTAVGNDAAAAMDARLRDLARVLGPVRDRDVFQDGALATSEALLPDEPRLRLVRNAVARDREQARLALAAVLDGAGFRLLVLDLCRFIVARDWRIDATEQRQGVLDAPLVDFAARELTRRRKRMLRGHDRLEGVPIATLHALRLAGKRLRYAAEFFAPLFTRGAGKATRRYLKRLAALQEALGLVNDADVAQALLAGLHTNARKAADLAWATGAVAGVTAAAAATARHDAEAAWREFRDAAPFWED